MAVQDVLFIGVTAVVVSIITILLIAFLNLDSSIGYVDIPIIVGIFFLYRATRKTEDKRAATQKSQFKEQP